MMLPYNLRKKRLPTAIVQKKSVLVNLSVVLLSFFCGKTPKTLLELINDIIYYLKGPGDVPYVPLKIFGTFLYHDSLK